jgi:3-methyladenine DNA glycosylase AlkD
MIDDHKLVTEKQMDNWVKDFNSWDICDGTCLNLFKYTPVAYKKAIEWSSHKQEYVKRAGFSMMACLAVGDKKAEDKKFIRFFSHIKCESNDERNFVRKAVNWALRQIGKRNMNLNRLAIKVACEIQKMDSKSARWIAQDALRELQDPKVRKRLKRC